MREELSNKDVMDLPYQKGLNIFNRVKNDRVLDKFFFDNKRQQYIKYKDKEEYTKSEVRRIKEGEDFTPKAVGTQALQGVKTFNDYIEKNNHNAKSLKYSDDYYYVRLKENPLTKTKHFAFQDPSILKELEDYIDIDYIVSRIFIIIRDIAQYNGVYGLLEKDLNTIEAVY